MSETVTIEYATTRIRELEQRLEAVKGLLESHEVTNRNLSQRINAVGEYLTEQYDDLGEHANEIASLLEIDLTTERTLEVTVTFNITIEAPLSQTDADEIASELDYEVTSGWGSDVSISDFSADVTYASMDR